MRGRYPHWPSGGYHQVDVREVARVHAAAMMLALWGASAVQRVVPFHLPAEYEGVQIIRNKTRCDDLRARQELGVQPRPLAETYRDTIRWLHHTGHLTARQTGSLVHDSDIAGAVPIG